MAWYDNNWNYRKAITISNTGYALTDYQTLVTVDTATPVSSGKMLSNCNDIRFTSSDGSTLLNYWIESGPNNVSTKIWVKIDSILASPSTTTIYLYYGNPSATAASTTIPTFIREIGSATEQPVKGAWTLDGNALDTSGNNNNGTLYGGTGYTTGKFAQAALFNGTTNYIDIGSADKTKWNWMHGAADTSGFKFTAEAWIKITDFTVDNAPFGTSDLASPATGVIFDIGTTRTMRMFIARGVYTQPVINFSSPAGSYPADNNFHHVVFTYDQSLASGNVKVYLDGTINSTGDKNTGYTPSTSDSSDFMRIGWAGNGAYSGQIKFKGIIDEVRIYNRVLTSSEITDLYNNYGYVTTNYPGRELVRKYVSPEPTVSSTGTEEVLTGDLNISSTPIGAVGASVYIDGNGTPSGVTPLIITGFTPGTHTYRLTKAGYTEIPATNFTITSGQTTTISQAMLTVANIGATLMTITPSENPCRTGICTALVSVTWVNSGQTAGSSNLSITVGGGTSTITPSSYPSVSFAANGIIGDTIIETFTVSGLSAGTHSICPNPN